MATWTEEYSNTETNEEIAVGATAGFGRVQVTRANRSKYGSMNTLLITVNTAASITVTLDGQVFSRTANASISIAPEDGYFFNLIDITNNDGSAIAADLIKVRYGRSRRIAA